MKTKRIKLIKWFLLPTLILAFLGGLGGQDALQGIHSQSIAKSVELSSRNTCEKIYESEVSSFCRVFGDFEIEEEEEEEDQPFTNRKSYQLLPLLLVIKEIRGISSFKHKKLIKLFILFHSWKSFLPI